MNHRPHRSLALLVTTAAALAAAAPSFAAGSAEPVRVDGGTFASVPALRRHVESKGVAIDGFLRSHAGVVAAFRLRPVSLDQQRYFTRAGVSRHLAAGSVSYARWSTANKPSVAVLAENERADVRRIQSVAATEAVTVNVADDTYVSAAKPKMTFGFDQRLKADSAPVVRSYLRFSLAGVTGTIERARLSVYATSGSGAIFDVRGVAASTWAESTLVYNNAPAVAATVTASGAARAGSWTTVDVTPLVTGSGPTLALTAAARDAAFGSREAGLGARLLLDVAPAQGSPPPPVTPPPPPVTPPPPPVGTNPYRGRVGVVTPTVWMEADQQLAMLQAVRAAGVTWIREDFHWGAVERSQGVWNWEIPDRLMRSASFAGVDVLATIAYSAEWATTGPDGHSPPTNPAQYANFVREVVLRYGAGGQFWAQNPSLTPRPLQAVEIWNEPWVPAFWGNKPDPAAYIALLRPAAVAVRSVHPEVKILASADIFYGLPGTTESLDWFRNLLPLDPALFRDYIDAYSVHAYSQDRGPRDTIAAQRWRFDRVLMTRDLAAAAGASHPIWVTEFGWSTTPGYADSVTEAQQASYTTDALKRTVEEWGSFVERSFVYSYSRASSDYVGGYALLRADGSAKPAWGAIAALLA